MTFDKSLFEYTEDTKEWAKVIINKLHAESVGGAHITIHGSGDSPQDEDFEWIKDPVKGCFDNANMIPATAISLALREEIREFCWQWSDEKWGTGWYNDDGGRLEFEIIVLDDNPRITMDAYWYRMEEDHQPQAEL